MRILLLIISFLPCPGLLNAQDAMVGEWWFWPDYSLGGKAKNYPGPKTEAPLSVSKTVDLKSIPLVFHGEDPTERITGFLPGEQLPKDQFTVELWLVNHVNQPIGALVTEKSRFSSSEPSWLLGCYGRDLIFTLKTSNAAFSNILNYQVKARGWKKYWGHLVGTYDGENMSLYFNGKAVSTMKAGERPESAEDPHELEVASYMNNEPYMDLGNLVKCLRVYSRALSPKEIRGNFEQLKTFVVEGKLYPHLFHFNAGPYLHYATTKSINLVWETDRPANAVVEYGTELPLKNRVEVNSFNFQTETIKEDRNYIREVTLEDLEPGTTYFYNIKAIARDGQEIETGILTFGTAVGESNAFSFAVIGDTEARPHINDRISKLVWDERPNFAIIVGDLTDGGKEPHKFEWNYEYFAGMTQLTSRIPVFPVPGNGEGDLYWYNRYHKLPDPEGYYSFRYGNAEFFMLNSNEKEEFAPGGAQYQWLEKKLKQSDAVWKFVAHHHAPYSADEDDYGNSWEGASVLGDLAVRKIVPLYERYGVDMVFFGHLHTYQRTLPIKNHLLDEHNGVIYVQGGGGGGNLEDFAPSRAWFSAKTYRGHHYCTVSIHGRSLDFKMYDSEGRMKDFLGLKK